MRRIDLGPGGSRFLEGDFECGDGAGPVAFRVEGWRDRYFEVPHRFYQVRSQPLRGALGEDWSREFGLPGVSVRVVPPFAPGFLEDAGAIWKRLLAAVYLGRGERRAWRELPRDPRVRTAWLLEQNCTEGGRPCLGARGAGGAAPPGRRRDRAQGRDGGWSR